MKGGIEKMVNEGVWKKVAHKYWVNKEQAYPQQNNL
jgi:hypothetical protein